MSDKRFFPQANNTLLWQQRYTHEQTRYNDIYINHHMNFTLSVGRIKKWLLSTFIPLFAFPTLLLPLQLVFNIYKCSLIYLYLTLHIYSFFPFLSTYLLILFSLLYSPIGTLLQFCFLVYALISLVLEDITLPVKRRESKSK